MKKSIVAAIAMSICLMICGTSLGGPQSKIIYMNHNDIAGNEVNMPLLINGDSMDAAFWTDVEPNGADVWVEYNGKECVREVVLPSSYKTKCILNFDDSWQDVYDNAYPIMEAYGFKGTDLIISTKIGTQADDSNYLTLDNLNFLYNHGWDLINHTSDHIPLTALTEAQQEVSIGDCRDYLVSNGFTRNNMAYHFGYPDNCYDANAFIALAAKGMLTARSAGVSYGVSSIGYILNQPTITTSYLLKSEQLLGVTTLSMAEDYIDEAILERKTVILLFHRVSSLPQTDWIFPTSDFQSLMDYLYSKRDQIEVVTKSEWYNGLTTSLTSAAIDVNNKKLELYFLAPVTSSTVDIPYTIHWGDWSLVKSNDGNVWDVNTRMVQHMGRSAVGASPQLPDSTINGNDLNASSGWVTSTYVGVKDGKMGLANDFNACGYFSVIGGAKNLNNATISGATISFWADINTPTNGTLFSKGYTPTTFAAIRLCNVSDFNMRGKIGGTSSFYKTSSGLADFRNVWHYYAMRWNNSTDELSLYIDGVSVLTTTDVNDWPTNSTFSIGASTIFKGSMDEVRISDVDRGANWILTSYNNQSDPKGFWEGSGEQEKCGGADLNKDGNVTLADLAKLAHYWLYTNCAALNNCEGADLQPEQIPDGDVDIGDLDILTEHWLYTNCQ